MIKMIMFATYEIISDPKGTDHKIRPQILILSKIYRVHGKKNGFASLSSQLWPKIYPPSLT